MFWPIFSCSLLLKKKGILFFTYLLVGRFIYHLIKYCPFEIDQSKSCVWRTSNLVYRYIWKSRFLLGFLGHKVKGQVQKYSRQRKIFSLNISSELFAWKNLPRIKLPGPINFQVKGQRSKYSEHGRYCLFNNLKTPVLRD